MHSCYKHQKTFPFYFDLTALTLPLMYCTSAKLACLLFLQHQWCFCLRAFVLALFLTWNVLPPDIYLSFRWLLQVLSTVTLIVRSSWIMQVTIAIVLYPVSLFWCLCCIILVVETYSYSSLPTRWLGTSMWAEILACFAFVYKLNAWMK